MTKPLSQPVLMPMVKKLAYHVDLDLNDREAICGLPHVVKTIQRHHYVIRERELASHSCVLLSGYSIRSKIVGTGGRQILAIHMRGDLIDLQNSLLEVADHSVQALTECNIAMIPREEITRLAFERPAVGKAMWKDTLVEASIAREWIANVGRRDARTRIAHLLCEFSLRLRVAGLCEDNDYELPMTQEQLADTTGLTPVHVNRSLKALQKEGLIGRTSPRTIEVGDWHKLAHAGDFDSNYLHLRPDEPAFA
jgi:CRP-like cAMP-binding protein